MTSPDEAGVATGDRTDGSVAVVGIGCRYAGGVASAADLWALLRSGAHTAGEVPPERWRADREHSREHAAALTRVTARGSFLRGDVDAFDAAFFGIPAAEAEQLDPQQRLALEVAWEALEDAGIVPASLAGTSAAVYLGVGTDDHGRRLLADLPHVRPWTGIGASLCGVPNRVSHALDLRGPSAAVDTACSSSLVAIHQACTALRAGETDLALAGGVMLMTGPGLTAVLVEAGALGPDGRSRPFDAAADGYGRGEGAGVVVLKRLADARADGDDVLAVIRGGAVRQDGRTDGIMAPSGDAQQDLMRAAYAAAGVDPATVGHVEAHGTGTPAGDPMEGAAFCAVLARDADAAPCRVGAVKASIGHTEAAAGVAGLIAVTLALRHRYVPGIAGLTTPRTDVPWQAAHVQPAVGGADWPDPGHPRRAGVASYGYGGTIAHLVLEEGDPVPTTGTGAGLAGPTPFVLSAASPEALAEQAGRLAEVVAGGQPWPTADTGRQPCATAEITADPDPDPDLADVAHTLARHRASLRHRAAVTAADRDTLGAGLRALAAGDPHEAVTTGDARRPGGAVWVFSGHGQQWVGMGRGLLDVDPDFTAVIDRLGPVYRAELGVGPREVITADDLGGVDRIQATLCAVQLGLAAVWRARGAEPAAVIGHSVGEIAAAVVAGALDETDGARLVCRRSALLPRVAGHGAMVLVDLPFDACTDLVPGAEAAIAAAPSSTVVAGDMAAVEEQARRFEADGRTVRRIDSDVAFHTAQMGPLADLLRAAVAPLAPAAPTVPLYATARPDPRGDHRRDADYWADNLRRPVRFADAVAAAHADGHRTFLEISAHPVVAHSIAEGAPDAVVVPSLRRDRPEPEELARAATALHCRGVPVGLRVPCGRPVRLPGVAWQRRTLRVERRPATRPGPASTLLGAPVDVHGTGTRVWSTTLHDRTRPYPGHHPVLGVEIVPAAVTLATYLAAGEGALRDVALSRPVVVPGEDEDPAELQVVRSGDTLRLATRPAGGTWGEHSSARIGTAPPATTSTGAADEILDPAHVVDRLAELGVAAMGFGWEVEALRRGEGRLVATVAAPDWPSLLDAALSTASVVFDGEPTLRMPASIAAVVLEGPAPEHAEVIVTRADELTVDVDVRGDGAHARLVGLRYAAPEATDTRPELGETVFVLDRVPGYPGPAGAPVPADPRAAVRDLLDAVRAGERRSVALPGPDDGSGAWAAAGLARVLATEHPELVGEPVAADGSRLRAVPLGPGSSAPVCRPDGTYLVTGGFGAVGRAVAAHLAERGARRLVLLGRRAPDRAGGAFDAIEAAGATVFPVAADVTDADAVRAALDALPVPPVRGVVHAAGAVRSGPALELSDEDVEVTLAAKADGAAVLDSLFPPGSLDFLALFSSAGPLLGLPGQGAYAAANACLDGLAARRRAAGDTGTVSIAWTSWEGLGMARAAAATDVELDARGAAGLAPHRALAALDRILAARHDLPGTGTVAVLPIRTDHDGARPPLLDALDLGDGGGDDGDAPFDGLSGDELHAVVAAEARAAAGAVVGIDPEDLDPQLALTAQGVDSLLAASLRVRLERRTGVALAPTVLWNHPTLDALGAHLTEKLEDA